MFFSLSRHIFNYTRLDIAARPWRDRRDAATADGFGERQQTCPMQLQSSWILLGCTQDMQRAGGRAVTIGGSQRGPAAGGAQPHGAQACPHRDVLSLGGHLGAGSVPLLDPAPCSQPVFS